MPSIMASSKLLKKLLWALLPLAFWIGVWQLAACLVDLSVEGRGNELLLPYPVSVLKSLLRLGITASFWKAVAASLGRILAGMVLGVLAGIALAVLTSASAWCDRLLSPGIRVVRATPVASFILLVLLWTGRNTVPVVISALMVLPVVWENFSRGIRATDRQLLEMAKAYRFSAVKTIGLIYLPSLRPYFSAALTNAMGLAWKSGAAAEVLCLPKEAIGTQIYNAKLYLEIPDLFAWTVVVVGLSLILEKLLRLCLSRWNGGGEG